MKDVGPERAPALERYLAAVAARNGSEWSATHNVLDPVLEIAGDDVAVFGQILAGISAVMAHSNEARFEQQAIRACIGIEPAGMLAVLETAAQLAQPGWFVHLVVPPLVRRDEAFLRAWTVLSALAIGIERDGQHVGYPVALGLATLINRGDIMQWAESILVPLAHAAKDSIYGLFEYGVTGVAERGLDDHDIGDALRLAIAMFDHGLEPAATLQALGSPVQLDLATKLAKAGIDPRLVITNGVAYFQQIGQLEDGGERLEKLAISLHQRGLRQLLFEDGLDYLLYLQREHGLADRGIALIETMISRDLEPAIIFRWSMPRTVGYMRPAWSAAELLGFAEMLVERNLAPESAITWAARPLAEIATDAEDFRRLAGAVVALVAGLQAFGVDHREVLFHDVAALAQAGNESQTFRELLEAFSGLLAAWTGDAEQLLETALPAAAREAVGRPWVLAIALANATRMVREGRNEEAITLLSVGVRTAAQLDPDRFEASLLAVEKRYATLPAELASHASIAAGVLAGTHLERLDRALQLIAEANQRQAITFANALPDLARMAGDPDGFAMLLEAMRSLPARVAHVAAQTVRGDAVTAKRVIEELGRWANTPDKLAALDRFTFGRIASPSGLVACVERAYEALAGLPDRRVLTELLEHARTEATFVQMCTLLPPLLRDARGPLVDGVQRVQSLVANNPHAWTYLVAPALVTAKQHAGALLSVASWIPNRFIEREADIEVIRDLVTQRGVRAVELIANLVVPALARKVMPSLAEHRELLERYLREVGFSDADVYGHFVEIVKSGGDAKQIAALRAEISELTAQIRAGDIAQRDHALFDVALQHVFPSAVSATAQMWRRLVDTMPDRQPDVLALWPHGHDKPLEVAAGSWQLVGMHDVSVFGWLATVIPDRGPRDMTTLGWELVTAWSEGRLAREKLSLTRALLAHVETLPSATYDSASQLLAIRALAADRLSGLVETAVVAARADDPDRVDRLVQTRLAPAPRIGPGLIKALAKTLAAIRDNKLSRDAGIKRLQGQLAMFELPEDPIAALDGDLATALHGLPARRAQIEPGKELARIHADLVGQELAEMTAVIARALEYRPSSQLVMLDCTITKRALHAPIGLTAGVCVASDLELWNSPGFMHLALWLDGICMGSAHLLVLTEGDKRYLALPGINPSFALLDRVEAAVVLRKILERAIDLAREAGLAGVWVPTAPGIHSNRRSIHEALVELNLPEQRTSGHAFSYSPYAYRIDTVYKLELTSFASQPAPVRSAE
jgi:hypothetical protein